MNDEVIFILLDVQSVLGGAAWHGASVFPEQA